MGLSLNLFHSWGELHILLQSWNILTLTLKLQKSNLLGLYCQTNVCTTFQLTYFSKVISSSTSIWFEIPCTYFPPKLQYGIILPHVFIIIELFFQMQMILMHNDMIWIIYICCIEMLMVDMKIDKIMRSKFCFIFLYEVPYFCMKYCFLLYVAIEIDRIFYQKWKEHNFFSQSTKFH